jgi:DNA-binding protein
MNYRRWLADDDSTIVVGSRRKFLSYILAAELILKSLGHVTLAGCGDKISLAVDVAEIVRRRNGPLRVKVDIGSRFRKRRVSYLKVRLES